MITRDNIGGKVVFTRIPTHREWDNIGEVPIPEALQTSLNTGIPITVKDVHPQNNSLSIEEDRGHWWYPIVCFEKYNEQPTVKDSYSII